MGLLLCRNLRLSLRIFWRRTELVRALAVLNTVNYQDNSYNKTAKTCDSAENTGNGHQTKSKASCCIVSYDSKDNCCNKENYISLYQTIALSCIMQTTHHQRNCQDYYCNVNNRFQPNADARNKT